MTIHQGYGAPESDLPWPTELEAAEPLPPQNDFDLSRLWRRARREQFEIDRLRRYLALVGDCVEHAMARRQERIEEIKQYTLLYLGEAGQRKAVLPDLGTVHLTTRKQVTIDAVAALAWAEAEARQFIVLEPRLDRDALKRHVVESGEVIPGVAVIEEVTTVAFRPR